MAKQKSGLGRGLGALFDDSSSLANNSSQSKHPEPQEKAVGGPTAQTEQSRAVSVSRETETSSTSQVSREAKPGSSSNIYISEDALEHAKVVSREARPKPHVNLTQSRTQQRPSVSRETQPHRPISQQSTVVSHDSPQQVKPSSKPGTPSIDKGDIGVVPLHKVTPNPDQPRTNFKKEEIEELAGSIKREGLLQPILVRKVGDAYQIIAGERRWQACKTLDMKEIPVRFWKADNDKALELALIENIQRSDLNPIEEAYGYKRLMERRGMTQSEVAQTVSKGRSTIANALRLLELPEEAQQLLFEDRITAGHARAILSIPDAAGRKTLTTKLMNEKLSVREAEAIARLLSGRAMAAEKGSTKRIPAPASFKKAARGLTRFFSVPVKVKTAQGKNKIEIQFKDEADLERILSLIDGNGESDQKAHASED